jgi:hypothetical protein
VAQAANKGNNPVLWSKLIEHLDERLQLGLLDKVKKATHYHFEEDTLIVEVGTVQDEQYLTKDVVFQQFTLLAQDATGITNLVIRLKP